MIESSTPSGASDSTLGRFPAAWMPSTNAPHASSGALVASGSATTESSLSLRSESSCSCVINVEVVQREICGCDRKKIEGTASASCPLTLVSVPLPNGLAETGVSSVTFSFFATDEMLGTTVAVWAYGSENCTPGVGYVDVLDVRFQVDGWDPQMDTGDEVTARITQRLPLPAKIQIPYPTSEDLFSVSADVTISTVPESTSDVADACCAEWRIELIQNIVAFGVRRITYQQSTITCQLEKVPALDSGDLGETSKDFTQANETLSVFLVDTPGFRSSGVLCFEYVITPPDNIVRPTNNALTLLEDDVTFMTWLTVLNTTTGERRFLKWARWRSTWSLNVHVPPGAEPPGPIPEVSWRSKELELIGSGDGDGGEEPVFTPRVEIYVRNPPL